MNNYYYSAGQSHGIRVYWHVWKGDMLNYVSHSREKISLKV